MQYFALSLRHAAQPAPGIRKAAFSGNGCVGFRKLFRSSAVRAHSLHIYTHLPLRKNKIHYVKTASE